MSNLPDSSIRTASESDRKPESEVGSNERTNERTDASDRIGRQSGAGSRRTRAYEDSEPVSLSSAASGWLDEWEPVLAGQRWEVVRSGDRDPIPAHVRAAVWYRDKGRCVECLPEFPRSALLHLDHIVPWSAGGPDTTDNLRMLCESHNLERSNYVDFAKPVRSATWWCANCYTDTHRWLYSEHSARCGTSRHHGSYKEGGSRCRVTRAYERMYAQTGEPQTWHQRRPLQSWDLIAYCAHCDAPGMTGVVL